MKLKSLTLQRFPGLRRSFTLKDIGPGLNVIVGPNASGKTSICHAVRRLLWPKSMPLTSSLSIQSEWESAQTLFSLQINEASTKDNPVLVEPSGAFPLKSLPDSAFMPCFSMTIDELFDEKDHCFAQKIGQEMMGGYDVEKAAALCVPPVPAKAAVREWKEATQRLERYHLAERLLREESTQLPQLEQAIAEAEAAQNQARILEKKGELAKWYVEEWTQLQHLKTFPPELAQAVIYPTDRRDYEQGLMRQQEIAQHIQHLETQISELRASVGEGDHLHVSAEELEAHIERIGRMQAGDAEYKERAKHLEKLECTVGAHRHLLGLCQEEEIQHLHIEELDLLRVLWREADKIEMEIAGLQEQLRLYATEEGTHGTSSSFEEGIQCLCEWAPLTLLNGWTVRAWLAFLIAGTVCGMTLLWTTSSLMFWIALMGLAALTIAPLKWCLRYTALQERYRRLGGRSDIDALTLTDQLKQMALALSLAKWQEHQQQRKADLQVRLQQKQEEHRDVLDKLHEQAGRVHLTLFCPTYIELIDRIKMLYADWIALREARIEMAQRAQQLDREKEAWGQFIAPFQESSEADPWSVYTRIQNKLAQAALLRQLQADLLEQREEQVRTDQAVRHLIQRIGGGEVFSLLELWPAYQDTQKQLVQIQRQIQEIQANWPALATGEILDEQHLEAERCQNEEKMKMLMELSLKKGNLTARIQQKETALEGETLLNEWHEKMGRVRAICLDFVKRELTAKLVADVKSDFQQDCQPVVLEKAMEWFQRFTQHQFRLEAPSIQSNAVHYSVVETSTGERRTLEQLSRGTRMQLLIAVRLSFAFYSEEGGEPLPIFLDEVLANTDVERFDAVASVVAELLAQGRQVFYLTCNPEDALKWKKNCPEAHLIDLAKIHSDQAYLVAPLSASVQVERIPKPPSSDFCAYAQMLKLPALRIDEPIQMVSIHYLLEQVDDLHRLLSTGIHTYGQFQSQRPELLEKGVPASFATMTRRAHLLEQFFRLKTQGRGKRLSREVLVKGGVSKKFIDPLLSLVEEKEGNTQAFIDYLEDKRQKDERKKGFRREIQSTLKAYLIEHGYLDGRPILDPDQIRCELLPLTLDVAGQAFVEQLLCS